VDIVNAVVHYMTTFLEWLFYISSMIGLPYWGMAIVLFTIIIKMILYPLTRKQMVSMRRISELQPKMQALQKKYAHDRQKLNQKIMELYSDENVSPYAGCLPILIQLPILWVFYRTLYVFPYGNDASVWFLGFNITVAYGFTFSYHLILPLVAGVTTFFMTKVSMMMSQKTSGTNSKDNKMAATAEQTQKIMLIFMPFFVAYIVATLPSGLGIYIVTMNIMSFLQSLYIYKRVFPKIEKSKAEA